MASYNRSFSQVGQKAKFKVGFVFANISNNPKVKAH